VVGDCAALATESPALMGPVSVAVAGAGTLSVGKYLALATECSVAAASVEAGMMLAGNCAALAVWRSLVPAPGLWMAVGTAADHSMADSCRTVPRAAVWRSVQVDQRRETSRGPPGLSPSASGLPHTAEMRGLPPCDALQHSAAMGEESLLGLGHATVVPGGLHVSLQASEPQMD